MAEVAFDLFFCNSLRGWKIEVPSSEQGKFYTVRWEERTMIEIERSGNDAPYGFTCGCLGFQHRGKCRHIELAKLQFCGWSNFLYQGKPTEKLNEKGELEYFCPNCGGKCSHTTAICE
jgi:hypothetical protein